MEGRRETDRVATVEVEGLKFAHPGPDRQPQLGAKMLFDGLSLTLCAGDRCLLVGSNGAGKTTLLQILAGKHMVEPQMVCVLGRSAFHDTILSSSGDLCYLGGEWRREVPFCGFEVPMQMDISSEKMIFGVPGIDPHRRDELIQLLDIDLSWRMHKVSDGQRRRVQICMGLLQPFKVLLLDEITVDLDVLARVDLMEFLKVECEERGSTIVYATHIFDGLDGWPTHVAYLVRGKLQMAMSIQQAKEMMSNLSLMRCVECWLRKEKEEERLQKDGSRGSRAVSRGPVSVVNNGWASGRLHSTLAGDGNSPFSSSSFLNFHNYHH